MFGFADWLIGLAAQQPRQYRRLTRIRSRVYTPIRRLDAEMLASPEPIPFAALDRGAFEPVQPGTAWGTTGDCAWLHVHGALPDGVTDAVILLGIAGEGLVYTPEGDIVDAVSTVFQQGDLPHSGGRFRPVRGLDTTGGTVDFFADLGYNGWLLYPIGRGRFHGAMAATRDADAYALYYDYLTLVVLAGATDDPALATTLSAALDAAWSRFVRGDIRGARADLAPMLAAESTSEFVYSAVGHGHLDMAWLWPWRETRRKAARTYARALTTIDERPGYVYGTSQPQQLMWMKQEHPALYERLQQAVDAGRIELQGSFWVETDTNLPGGESLVRQALVGRRFLGEEFGRTDDDLRLCWLPDTFGYSGNLPQILKKSGMDWFMTIKLAWNKVTVFPHRTFTWQGIDGSSVLVHMPPEGDYNSRAAADNLLTGLRQYPEKKLGTALLVYGSGDGGGGPGEIHLELTEREHSLHGLPRLEYSTATDFFRGLERMPIEHTHAGELYLETHQGTYTVQAQIKRHNRLVERMLHEAEALAAIVGDDDGTRTLEPLWREVLLTHFHDVLPGSSIARVNREALETYERVEAALHAYIASLVDRLPAGAGESVLNLTAFHRREHVQHDGSWFQAEVAPYATAALAPIEGEHGELRHDADTISNGLITLRFGPAGDIVSCIDADGREHAGRGLNRLVLHRDPYQFPFDAWDIGIGYTRRTPRTLRATGIRVEVDGPTVVRTQAYRTGRSTIVQRIVLEAGSDLVRVETTVDWHERHRMLRAEFRPTHFGTRALSEIQFGHIARPTTENDATERAQFETCAHKWIATQDARGGFALLNDSKYGHRAKNGLVSINLLRSPTFPDKTADQGIHRFSYAFRAFDVDDLTPVIRDAYRLNNPLLPVGDRALTSVAGTSNPAVVIETIKPAQNGSGVVLRLYESLGSHAVTALRTGFAYGEAIETNLMEEPLAAADLESLAFGPFEIKTILLETTP